MQLSSEVNNKSVRPLKGIRQLGHRHPTLTYYCCYTLVFTVLAFFVFMPFIQQGKALVWDTDPLSQPFQAMIYIGQWVRESLRSLFTGSGEAFYTWDWSLGYGADVIQTLNYYGLGDPLSLIAIFSPPSLAGFTFLLITLLRFYLSGLFFSVLGLFLRKGRIATLMGAICYAFCGFALFAGVRHPFFLTPLVYFPLVVTGMELVIRNDKPGLFIVSIFLSAISNFYFFYMTLVATVLYGVYRYFLGSAKRSPSDFIRYMGYFLVFGFIGVCMASALLIPVVLGVLDTSRSQYSYAIDLFYNYEYYENYLAAFISPVITYYLSLCFPPIVFASTVSFFADRRRSKCAKLGIVLLILLTLFPFVGSIFNGLSYPTERWSWALALPFCFTLVDQWNRIANPTQRLSRIMIVVCVCYASAIAFIPRSPYRGALTSLVVLFAIAALIALKANSKGEATDLKKNRLHVSATKGIPRFTLLLMFFCCLGIINNSNSIYGINNNDYVKEFRVAGTLYGAARDYPYIDVAKVKDDDEFARLDTDPQAVANASIGSGISSTNMYWSVTNGHISDLLMANGVNINTTWGLKNLEERAYLKALAGVKYNALEKDDFVPFGNTKIGEVRRQYTDYELYENQNALPFGVAFKTVFPRSRWDELSLPERQEALLQTAVVDDNDANQLRKDFETPNLSFNSEFLSTSFEDSDSVIKLDGNDSKSVRMLATCDSAELRISFPEGTGETYLLIEGANIEPMSLKDLYFDEDQTTFPSSTYETLSKRRQLELTRSDERLSNWTRNLFPIEIDADGSITTVQYSTPYYSFTTNRDDWLINLGENPHLSEVTITFPYAGIYEFDSIRAARLPLDQLPKLVETLKEEQFELTYFGQSSVRGGWN